MKLCSRCGEEKPTSCFSPHRSGFYSYCRPCAAAYAQARNADPEERARKAAYQRNRRSDPASASLDRETSRRWKIENPERARAHSGTPAKLAANKAWNEAHPERRREYVRGYQARNPEIGRVSQQRRRARIASTESTLTQRDWLEVLDEFNHACGYCLRGDVALQQEHMTPIARGGAHTRSNVIPACGPCNYKKHTRDLLEFLGVGGKAS